MVDTRRIKDLPSVSAPTTGDRIAIDGTNTRSITLENLGVGLTNLPWKSIVTIAGQASVSLSSTHRRAFVLVDTFNSGGVSVGSTTLTLEAAATAGANTFVTIKKQKDDNNHGGMVIVVPTGADVLEGKTGIVAAENKVRWEYPGEEFTWISDGVSKWHLAGSLWSKRGALFKGTHTVGSGDYSTSTTYALDAHTGNGQWFQVSCNGVPDRSVGVDLPLVTDLADGYSQTTFAIQRMDGTGHTAQIRASSSTFDGKEVGYVVPLYNYLDAVWLRADGSQYRTMAELHAHQTEICECKLSTSATVVTNGVVSPATTIHFTQYSGMRVALPTDEAAGGHYQRWIIHSFPGTPISKAIGSAGTYGVAAGNSVWHDIFVYHPTGFNSPVIFLAPSYAATRGTGAGTSELILLGGVSVNKVAISGSTSVPAQAARYVGRIFTNGAGAAVLIYDEFDRAPGNQTLSPDGSATKAAFGYVDDPDTGIIRTSSGTQSILSNGVAVTTFNGSAQTMENGAAFNGNAVNDTSMRVSRAVGSGASGSVNNSSSGSGAYVTHTPSITVPANSITTGRALRVRALMRLTTGATPPTLSYKMRLGGTSVAEITGSVPAANITTRTVVWEFILIGLAAAGAAANTETAVAGAANGYSSATIINNITQPVALATNGSLALDIQTQWDVAGVGTNTVTLMGITAELVN